jgi:hypothetical protein
MMILKFIAEAAATHLRPSINHAPSRLFNSLLVDFCETWLGKSMVAKIIIVYHFIDTCSHFHLRDYQRKFSHFDHFQKEHE